MDEWRRTKRRGRNKVMATRADYDKRREVYYKNYYRQLEGAKIEKFIGMDKDEFGGRDFPKFQVRYADGYLHEIVISRDEEGNGGGFLFLPFEPNMEEYDKRYKLNQYEEKEKR